ncbi:MAG: glycosyltransferase, partial [Chitinophagaceae bacterium]
KVWYANKKDRSQNLVEQVKAVRPDSLYIIGLFDWHFNIVPLLYADCADKLISVRGMLHPGALSQKSLKKKIFLQAMKWMKADKKHRFHATDETEQEYIQQVFGDETRISVAGNFPRLFPVQQVTEKTAGSLRLVSVGIISPMKNYALVIAALQQLKSTVHYDIYGPVKDTRYWEQCLEAIKGLPANITVAYHPELPSHKVLHKLQGQQVFILPSKSENYGHAIVEALSAGLPVITSDTVPWLGLEEARAGLNVKLGEESSAIGNLATAIERFATMDGATYPAYHEGASRYIRRRVDVEKLKTEYREMFNG